MVGKKSEKALRDEGMRLMRSITTQIGRLNICLGLERTDNSMGLSSWPVVAPINQKNYYTYVAVALLNILH